MAQTKPVQTLGTKGNIVKVLGELAVDSAILFPKDTIRLLPTDRGIAFKGKEVYKWNGESWGLINAAGGVNGSILNDSTFLLCNQSGCDTFVVQNITISSFTFTSDSTVLVCNTAGACDTISFSTVALDKFYVDSVIVIPGAVDTLRFYINGIGYDGGYIEHLTALNDGFITRGVVTWTGSGLTYNITGSHYVKNSTEYYSRDTTITLDPADPTYPRTDLFAVDTLGRTVKITGTPSPSATAPGVDQFSQLALTSGITLGVGDTIPDVTITAIYNENLGTPTEWTASHTGTMTVDFNNTSLPYNGTKDASITYSKNSQVVFTGDLFTADKQIVSLWVNLGTVLAKKDNIVFQFYNGSTAVTNQISVHDTYGLNPNLTSAYQQIAFPVSAFNWSGQIANKLVITFSGSGSVYMDYVQMQDGLQNIPPQTDYSNKADSVTVSGAKVYWWAKGIKHLAGTPTDTAFINSLITDSIAGKLNIGDTAVFSRDGESYTVYQSDSAYAVIRSEIVDAAGGGVISFNGRTGPVVSQQSDYDTIFYTQAIIDSLLALKTDTSDAFSGSYNDLTNKPVTVTNLSLPTATSTSQTIDNSNGTGVTLPSASITKSGLLTAADKVLVNTISGKLNITDTTGKWLSRATADLSYKAITYVPSWSEITGKPTFATVATTGSYNDLINKPTIPDNNNQLANGMGYITSIDSSNFLHAADTVGRWLQNIYARGDSLFKLKNGVETFVQKASSGSTDSSAYTSVTQYPDSATLNRPNGTKDAIVFPKTTIYATYPLYYNLADSSLNLSDSLPRVLKYAPGVDTADYTDNALINKGYLNDRLAAFVTDGVTQQELNDTAAAIRASFYVKSEVDAFLSSKQNTITLTTTGTSGAATLTGSTLNIPNYASGGISGGSIIWPGTLYSTPTTGTVSGSNLNFTPSLANQSAYTLFGRGSGSGTPSFLASIDSNWIPSLHSEAYYNTKYKSINAASGGLYAGTGTPFTTYAKGDLIYASGTDSLARLAAGTNSYILTLINGLPVWSPSGVSWSRSGNAGTTAGADFLGTTDDVDFVIKRNNIQQFRIYTDGFAMGNNASSVTAGTNSFGSSAGNGFTNSTGGSNFFGYFAGSGATNAYRANLFGRQAGFNASGANNSNIFGFQAGFGATNAASSNIFGPGAGNGATNAANSNLFGASVGAMFTGNNIGSNNIIIGTNISLPNATANSINLGNVLYGTGAYATVAGNPSITPQTTGRIGVGIVTPATSAILDLTSTTMGALVPRMTKTQRNAIAGPAPGLMIIVTGETGGEYLSWYNSSTSGWVKVTSTAD